MEKNGVHAEIAGGSLAFAKRPETLTNVTPPNKPANTSARDDENKGKLSLTAAVVAACILCTALWQGFGSANSFDDTTSGAVVHVVSVEPSTTPTTIRGPAPTSTSSSTTTTTTTTTMIANAGAGVDEPTVLAFIPATDDTQPELTQPSLQPTPAPAPTNAEPATITPPPTTVPLNTPPPTTPPSTTPSPTTVPPTTVPSLEAPTRTTPLSLGVSGSAILWHLEEATAWQTDTGTKASTVHGFYALTHDVPVDHINIAHAAGYEVMITVEPWIADTATNPAEAIASGQFDDHLKRWAQALRDIDGPVMFRFMHEMNGNWYPWAVAWDGNDAESVRLGYIHAWDLFQAEGATNLSWVWSPNEGMPVGVPYTDLYPGDTYVDIVGLDGYNGGTDIPEMGGWRSFEDIFAPAVVQTRAVTNRPIMISETASAVGGGDKVAWIEDMFSYLQTEPEISSVLWFQIDKRSNNEADWRYDSTDATQAAFVIGVETLASTGLLAD